MGDLIAWNALVLYISGAQRRVRGAEAEGSTRLEGLYGGVVLVLRQWEGEEGEGEEGGIEH